MGIFTKNNKPKKLTEKQIETQKLEEFVNKLKEYEERIKTGKMQVERINVRPFPQKIQEELLKEDFIFKKIFATKPEAAAPYLLILVGQKWQMLKKMSPGEYDELPGIKESKGKKIILKENKLKTLKIGGKTAQLWVHNLEEFESYPHEPGHASKATYEIIQRIQLNEGSIIPKAKGLGAWVKWLFIIAIIIGIGYGIYKFFFAPDPALLVQNATVVANTVQTAVIDNTTRVINIG
jgi:hypothetical protein